MLFNFFFILNTQNITFTNKSEKEEKKHGWDI